MKLAGMLLLLALSLTKCGTPWNPASPDLSASNVFPIAVGQHWDMRDTARQLTHFTVLPFGNTAACQQGEFVDLHVYKDSPEPYPDAGGAGHRISWGDWILKHEQGSWRLVSFMWTNKENGFFNTWQLEDSTDYWMVLPQAQGSIEFAFHYNIAQKQNLLACLHQSQVDVVGNPERMRLSNVSEFVDTPVYQGAAVKQDWCEQDNPPACDRAHEVWWYAPRIGVVQIEIEGPNTADGPIGYITKRID
jgi:hypothetical protein